MLTATYTLVALSVEQTSVRVSLQALQKFLQSNAHQSALTPAQVEYACDTIKRLYETCHWRKLDKFLIPAIRRASERADRLVVELDALSQAAAEAMTTALRCMESAAHGGEAWVAQFCDAVERFCRALLKRLEREEQELFPLATAAISGETWFSIANQMLAHDAYRQENRGFDRSIRSGRGYRLRSERAQRQGPPLSFVH